MPIEQSRAFQAAYQKLGLPVQLLVVAGAGHGGATFSDAAHLELIDRFLRAQLRSVPAPAAPVPAQASEPAQAPRAPGCARDPWA